MYLHTFEVLTLDGGVLSVQAFTVLTPQATTRVRHRRQRIELPDADDPPPPGGEDYEEWDWRDVEPE